MTQANLKKHNHEAMLKAVASEIDSKAFGDPAVHSHLFSPIWEGRRERALASAAKILAIVEAERDAASAVVQEDTPAQLAVSTSQGDYPDERLYHSIDAAIRKSLRVDWDFIDAISLPIRTYVTECAMREGPRSFDLHVEGTGELHINILVSDENSDVLITTPYVTFSDVLLAASRPDPERLDELIEALQWSISVAQRKTSTAKDR